MLTLLDLPNDVHNLLFDYIPVEDRRQTLVSLSQTCRFYLHLLGPSLYGHLVWRSLFLTAQDMDDFNKGPLSHFVRKVTLYALDERIPSDRKKIPMDRKTHWHAVDFRGLWKKDPSQRNLPELLTRIEALPHLEAVHIDLPLESLSKEVESHLHGYVFPKEKADKEAVYLFAQEIFKALLQSQLPMTRPKPVRRSLDMTGNMRDPMDAYSTAAWRKYISNLHSFQHNNPSTADYNLREVFYAHLQSAKSLVITGTTTEGLRPLLTPTTAPCIEYLRLDGVGVDADLAEFIAAHASRLETLILNNRYRGDMDPDALSVCFRPNRMPNLKHLRLADLPINPNTQDFLTSVIAQLQTLNLDCYCFSPDNSQTSGQNPSYTSLFRQFLAARPSSLQKLTLNIIVWPCCWENSLDDETDEHRSFIPVCNDCMDWNHTEDDYNFRHWFFNYHYADNICTDDDLPESTDVDWRTIKAAARALDDAHAYVDLRRWLQNNGCEVHEPEIEPQNLPWDPAWDHGSAEQNEEEEEQDE